MKLYFSPGTCSLSPHIALREAGLPFELVRVNIKTHQLADGQDFYAINPKGSVPVLELPNRERLTEGSAIVQFIADQAPQSALAPTNGSWERYRLQEWLNFITSELHKGFSPLFNPRSTDDVKAQARDKLMSRLKWVDEQLEGRAYLMGETFTVADGYLFTVVGWGKLVSVDVSALKALSEFMARTSARAAVQAALKAEGLLK